MILSAPCRAQRVERHFERDLRGTPGVRHVEVNAIGRTVRELQSEPGEKGRDLALSIDLDLQIFSAQRLKGLAVRQWSWISIAAKWSAWCQRRASI